MKSLTVSMVLFTTMTLITTSCHAQGTAGDLLRLCSTVVDGKEIQSADEAGCILYVGGFLVGVKYGAGNAMYRAFSKQGKSYKELTLLMEVSRKEAQCVPNSATPPQVARLFVQFAQKNPQKLAQGDASVLSEALNEYFNCVLTRSP